MTTNHLTDSQVTDRRAERLLDAGAVLPAGTLAGAGGPDSTVDVLTARSYRHPALDGRTVVRLVPGALGPAEDLACEFLGLAAAEQPAEVGQVRQEALGFPAWALVHDPANGHHALAVVKEMERLARQVKSKPGHAKDGFDELAGRLGRAVPHFLPTYCEQVGRIFLGQGNQTYAATYFGKAREAERTFNLEIDEERLRAVFLEFALGGALTVKALRQYVKDLAARLDARTAWQRFRQLCAERSAAGMAPYAGIAEDARALIKAAGLDQREQEQELLAELLPSPAIGRTPAGVWKSWRAPLIELARRDEAVRARLLEILPTSSGSKDHEATDTAWLEILGESGAELLLTDPQAVRAEPAARWLQRWTAHLNRGWHARPSCEATLLLASRMAERLRTEGAPVELPQGHPTAMNLLDLLLAERVPVADPAQNMSFSLGVWLTNGDPGRRTLAAVAADPRFRDTLKNAIPPVFGTGHGAGSGPRVEQYPVLQLLLAEWADDRADELLAARGLVGAYDLLVTLGPVRHALALANPQAAARIAGLDVAALLGRTLRAGLLDELGWPALEEGLRLLGYDDAKPGVAPGRDHKDGLQLEDAWPALILVRQAKAVVVGPDGVLLEHDLRTPADAKHWNRPRLRYVDGELLVAWMDSGKQVAYWSGRPTEVFALTGERLAGYYYGAQHTGPTSLPLPGGGRATGGRVLHAGDTAMPPERPVLGDGTGYWTLRRTSGGESLAEYDPATGTHGRSSVPPLFAAAAGGEPAGRLDPHASRLLPLQPGLERSPFGTDGTVLGGSVRRGAGRVVFHGTDGRTVALPQAGSSHSRYPAGRLDLPGGAALMVIAENRDFVLGPLDGTGARTEVFASFTTSHPGQLHAAGTALVPPPDHWHALRPRDEAGSRLLRAVTDRQAAELIDAAWPLDGEDVTPPRRPELLLIQGVPRQVAGSRAAKLVPVEAAAQVLPGLTHPSLVLGVAGLARLATETAVRAARYAPLPQPEADTPAPAAYQPEHGHDRQLRDALEGVFGSIEGFGRSWGETGIWWHSLANLRAVTEVLAEQRAPATAGWTAEPQPLALRGGSGYYGWLHLLGRTAPIALAAASPTTGEPAGAALALLLDELTRGWLGDRGPALRQVTLGEKSDGGLTPANAPSRIGQVLRHGDRTVVVLAHQRHHGGDEVRWIAVDHDPSGEFTPVGHFNVVEERRVRDELPARWIADFTALLRQHGPVAWQPERAEEFDAATGIGRARSALLLAAPPGLRGWPDRFLTADQLALLGLKATEAGAAHDWLRSVPQPDQLAVQAALLPADPAELWRTGLAAGAATECWLERRGRLVALPDDLQATVKGASIGAIEQLLNPASTPWLSRVTTQRVCGTDDGRELVPDDPAAIPGNRQLGSAVRALRWLAYHLPYGDDLRPLLPVALAALRKRIADPGLLLSLERHSTVNDKSLPDVLRAHYGLPEADGAGGDGLLVVGEALAIAPGRYGELVYLRPAALTGAPGLPLLDLLDGLVSGHSAREDLTAVRELLGDELTRLVADGSSPDEPAGWAQDPQRSVPALVGEAAKAYGIDEDAAALYLQLLALPDPTDRNTARWTGWKPTRLKRARAALAATDLVLEAKRARAGRSLFLPGGWQEARTPGLPVELWKAGLYRLPADQLILPPLPVPELFARAWQRIADAELPGYEELKTNDRKRGRR
ncbi:hypothetical protein [Kitasatospora sp. MAP5-34]|uniref:hypothetical protein n=1 Tax=Kitasatospora sp. MAP5-34 TaxID=3035102 RepID=UPI0024731EFE|nr:hypothetical protein [Kitasatospora sp. MAP5-34]MDH6580375.1 hypothetical protein [Kitasatospora sp. MAP5-34]